MYDNNLNQTCNLGQNIVYVYIHEKIDTYKINIARHGSLHHNLLYYCAIKHVADTRYTVYALRFLTDNIIPAMLLT